MRGFFCASQLASPQIHLGNSAAARVAEGRIFALPA